ncbi:MAG: hypothetical protein R2822_15530 [Spirosomataceae bacterium]
MHSYCTWLQQQARNSPTTTCTRLYLSLGTPLLQSNSNATKVLGRNTIERLFLENDNRQTPFLNISNSCNEA